MITKIVQSWIRLLDGQNLEWIGVIIMSFKDEREMHKATCADCGKECEVPFKPDEDRPVYCRDCFQKHRKPRSF